MSYFAKPAALILLLLNSAEAGTEGENHNHLKQWKSLFPQPTKAWSLQRSSIEKKAKGSVNSPSGYLIANQYQPTNVWYPHWCDFHTTSAFGIGTGMCFVGSVNGTAVGSVEYSLGGVGDGFLTVDYDVWNSLDCSGDATSGSYVVKTECDLHEETFHGIRYTYTEEKEPWKSYPPGLLEEYFDTDVHCAEGDSFVGMFGYISTNACVPVDQSNGSGTLKITQCGADSYDVNIYSDQYCVDMVGSGSVELTTCEKTAPSPDFSPVAFATYSCENN